MQTARTVSIRENLTTRDFRDRLDRNEKCEQLTHRHGICGGGAVLDTTIARIPEKHKNY